MAVDNRMEVSTKEATAGLDIAVDHIDRIPTVEVDNYRGLNAQIILVTLALNFLAFAQLSLLVGSGSFARYIAAVVGGAEKASWLAQIIGIATCALGPPTAQAADYWGRKWLLVGGSVLGFVGTMIISRANSMTVVIVGQVIASLLYAPSGLMYAVLSEIVPRKYRAAAQAAINTSFSIGGIFTLTVGSFWIKEYNEGFRIFFYFSSALLAVSAFTIGLLYNPPPRPLQTSLTTKQKLKQLDWTGYTLLTTGIILFSIGLSWAENPYAWKDAHVLATFLTGCAILIALAIHQTWVKKDGLFHHRLFKHDRNFALAMICIFVEGLSFFAANGFFPFEMSVLFDTDPVRIGARFSMIFVGGTVSAVLFAIYVSIFKKLRGPTIVSFVIFVIFNVLMATATLGSSEATWAYTLILGLGFGTVLTSLFTAAQLSAPPDLISLASGLMVGVRTLGGSIGFAVFNAIFNSSISKHLGSDIAAAVLPLGLSPKVLPAFVGALTRNNQKALIQIPGVTPQIIGAGVHALQTAYLNAFRYVWVSAAVFTFVGVICTFFLINPRMDLTMHVDAPLEKEDAPMH